MSQRTYYSEDAKHRAQMKTTIVVAICLALGASIGTVIAMLFAPQSGEETREDLTGVFEEQAKQGRKVTESAIKRLEHQVDDLRKKLEEKIG